MYIGSTLLLLLPIFNIASRSFARPLPDAAALVASTESRDDWLDVTNISTPKCSNGASCAAPDLVQALEDEEPKQDEDEAFAGPPVGTTARFTIPTLIVLSVLSVAGISYLVYTNPTMSASAIREKMAHGLLTLVSLLAPIRKHIHIPTSFRVGESRLVRWAQEDMGLLDMSEDEEDVMVNGLQSFEVQDEGIPLKPSPGIRRGVFANYGSAWR